ncbi:hypothetical protein K490DRAFT_60831 [Saccharata proteae CBS 121410]|uniref:Uncharacterized protein n=1 Tax=Saccharata proteae CBS 121410 TaxID=1314787 RepID=A0A9P4I1D3_9PEZI|nr:hypothetical protein K490DRAFT_60831 [Saccharata proteae CBS 121410]
MARSCASSGYSALSSDREDGGVALLESDLERLPVPTAITSSVALSDNPDRSRLAVSDSDLANNPRYSYLPGADVLDLDPGFQHARTQGLSPQRPEASESGFENRLPRSTVEDSNSDDLVPVQSRTGSDSIRVRLEAIIPINMENNYTDAPTVNIDPTLRIINNIPANVTLADIPGHADEIAKTVAILAREKPLSEIFQSICSLTYDRGIEDNGEWAQNAIQLLVGLELRLQDKHDKSLGGLDDDTRFDENIFILFIWPKMEYMWHNNGPEVSKGVLKMFGEAYIANFVDLEKLDFVLSLCDSYIAPRATKHLAIETILDVVYDKMHSDDVAVNRLIHHQDRLIESKKAEKGEKKAVAAAEKARLKEETKQRKAEKKAVKKEEAARKKAAAGGRKAPWYRSSP